MGKKRKRECVPIKQEGSFQPNEYMEIEIDNNTDVHIKEEDKSIYIEVPPIRLPIVCTTRLDNMCIMQLYLRRRKPKNIIKKIYDESKSAYHSRLGFKITCTCRKSKHKISFAKLQKKLSYLSTNSKVLENDERGSEIEQFSMDISSDDEVLSCMMNRKKEEAVGSILRDALTKDDMSDSDVELLDEIVGAENTSKDCTNLTTLVEDLSRSLDLKIINVMGSRESNVIIIIKNDYSHTTEIYVTDKNNTIFEFVTVPNDDYSFIYKMFNVSNCNEKPAESLYSIISYSLIQFTCCCWLKREKVIKARFSKQFRKFLSIPHDCSAKCSCCCDEVEEWAEANESILLADKLDLNFYSTRLNIYGVEPKTSRKHQLREIALNFEKPRQIHQSHNISNKKDLLQPTITMAINLKCIIASNRTRKNHFTEDYEFAGVGNKRDMVFHGFNIKAIDKIERIIVKFKDSNRDACCNFSLNQVLKEVGAVYELNQKLINYIDGIHKSIIFKGSLVQKCVMCRYNTVLPDQSNSILAHIKPVMDPIEHIRKAIVGQIVVPKVHMLEQTKYMEELSKTIQEMMVKLEGKFPNISFFINETGLPVASLPKPYNCYPIEDLTILTQVLQFAQHKITGQVPPVIYVPTKESSTVLSTAGGFIQLGSASPQSSSNTPYECEDLKTMESVSLESYDICSLMIKCNKAAYKKSFESFLQNSVGQEPIVMPTILNVCSLREDNEIARQLNEIVADDKNITITILDDDDDD